MYRVARVFFDEPGGQHYLMEISKKAGLAHTSVSQYLRELLQEKVIVRRKERRGLRDFPFFYANIDGENYKSEKRLSNLDYLTSSGLVQWLSDTFQPKVIVLLGSYSRGEDSEGSEIELFVQARGMGVDVSRFEKSLKRKLKLHFSAEFKGFSAEARKNIINGMILRGSIEGL